MLGVPVVSPRADEFVVELVEIADLVPHPENYREHPPEQVEEIRAGIERVGYWKNVVVAEDGRIVAGHGVVQGALEAGETRVPVVRLANEVADYVLVADNELTRRAVTDDRLLAEHLRRLHETVGLHGTGWAEEELGEHEARLAELAVEAETEPVEDPGAGEPPEEPQTRLGDVWLCGEHRVVCGDCTEVGVWEALPKWNLLFTSPPYGGGTNAGYKTDYSGATKRFYVHDGDSMGAEEWKELVTAMLICAAPSAASATSPAVLNVMYCANNRRGYGEVLFGGEQPFRVHETICWDKAQGFPSASAGILSRNWELVFVLSQADGYESTQEPNEVRWAKWDIPRPRAQGEEHKATFPIALAERALTDFTRSGAGVSDPFLGSGTTLIAAEQLGRVCYGMELEPRYVDVAVRRWARATGQVPTLEADVTEFEV